MAVTQTHRAVPSPTAVLDVSIVLPCLDEAETIAVCIRKALTAIEVAGLHGEVIVADNGSTDGSQGIAAGCGARVIDVAVRGYGAAVLAGIEAARAPYILTADADDSYEFAHLPRFLEALDKGADLVIGNRFQGGIRPGAMPFLHKYFGNPALTFLGRLFFHSPVGDFHCGIRAFRKSAIESLGLMTTGMEFASEMVVKASLRGLRIAEVPTTLARDGRSRAPHLRTWRDGWRHLRFLLLYSPRWLFLYPGIGFMGLGFTIAAWLIPGERTVGHVTFGIDTLAYALGCILVGFHACVFAVGARIFGVLEGLLPRDAKFDRWINRFSLEVGVCTGAGFMLLGIILSAYVVLLWYDTGFGNLTPRVVLRITLPAVTALLLGVEIIFTSFFLSLFGLKRS